MKNEENLLDKRYNKDMISYTEDGDIDKIQPVNLIMLNRGEPFYKKGEYFMMTKEFCNNLLFRKYTTETYHVLLALLTKIDYNNRIKTFRQKDIAEMIGTSQPNVSRAMKVLTKENIILKKDCDWYFNEKYVKYAGDRKK